MENVSPDNLSEVFFGSLQTFLNEFVVWLPKLVIALILWWLGNLLIGFITRGLKFIDVPGMTLDNKLIGKLNNVILFLGKFLVTLIILDYLGIGDVVIGAIAGGLTLTVALTLGIAFGLSLKPHTDKVVERFIRKVQR